MKICYIGQFPIPSPYANSVQVVKMCAAFAGLGHKVALLIPGDPCTPPDLDGICHDYGVPKAFRAEHVKHGNCRWAPHIYAWRAARQARGHHPDLIYSRMATACYFAAALGHPTIYESHMPVTGVLSRMAFRALVRLRSFKRLVCISRSLGAYYEAKYGLCSEKIVVAPDGADKFHEGGGPQRGARPLKQAVEVGFIGQLFDGHGIQTIVDLAAEFESVHFTVIGGTAGAVAHWQSQVKSHNIVFTGQVSHSKAHRLCNDFDVLLAPYQTSIIVSGGADKMRWMSPLKIFEYMAAGKAIVCSDLPVLREVLEHERTALLVPPDDFNAWCQTLTRLIGDAALRKRLGKAAQREFEAKYTWKERARRVLK